MDKGKLEEIATQLEQQGRTMMRSILNAIEQINRLGATRTPGSGMEKEEFYRLRKGKTNGHTSH